MYLSQKCNLYLSGEGGGQPKDKLKGLDMTCSATVYGSLCISLADSLLYDWALTKILHLPILMFWHSTGFIPFPSPCKAGVLSLF